MLRSFALSFLSLQALLFSATASAAFVELVEYQSLYIPITPFSNMASGYQATNPGFRAVLRSLSGDFVTGGNLSLDSVIRGYSDDASKGSAYGKLVLRVDMEESFPSVSSGIMAGTFKGLLSICMAEDPDSSIQSTRCKNLSGNIHPERPFQWINKKVDFLIEDGKVRITRYYGDTGEGGTPEQIALAVFHPAYGFAAPGKAFKDYQSPLVIDLNHNGKLDLVNVWNESQKVRFDLNGTGEKTRTGWVAATDGLLFWDNGSGCVTNGTQLLGEFTDAKQGEKTFENGFLALAHKLNAKTNQEVSAAQLGHLKIWVDKGTDGVCQPNEVIPAVSVMRSLSLNFETVPSVQLTEDNEIRLTGHYTGKDGKRHLIGDVWFKQRRNETAQAQPTFTK